MLKKFAALACAFAFSYAIAEDSWIISQNVGVGRMHSEPVAIGPAQFVVKMQSIFKPGSMVKFERHVYKITATVKINCLTRTSLITEDKTWDVKGKEIVELRDHFAKNDTDSPPDKETNTYQALIYTCGEEFLEWNQV